MNCEAVHIWRLVGNMGIGCNRECRLLFWRGGVDWIENGGSGVVFVSCPELIGSNARREKRLLEFLLGGVDVLKGALFLFVMRGLLGVGCNINWRKSVVFFS